MGRKKNKEFKGITKELRGDVNGGTVTILTGGVRDWGTRMPTPAEMADREERSAGWGNKKLRAAFYVMIGDAPILGPADHDGAQAYLSRISVAIARGGWTPSENLRLRQLHKKWFRRARGQDPYFEVYGNRRPWADGRNTYRNKDDQKLVECVRKIEALVLTAVYDQCKRYKQENETPSERRARLEEIERHRFRARAEGEADQD